MEALKKEWERLQEAAPPLPSGPPTSEEQRALTVHKQQVKSFLSGLSPEQRQQFETKKQAAKSKRKEANRAKTAASKKAEEDSSSEPKVHVTIALNSNRQRQKLVEVKASANLSDLCTAAKKKLNVKGTKKLAAGSGSIHSARTQRQVENGDPLEHGDLLLVSLGEAVEFGKMRKPNLDLPKGSPNYLLVLDFEATCLEKGAPKPQEIIELPTLLLNVKTGEVEQEFHQYIRPDVHPLLSDFCTELTGITQLMIDERGISLWEALERQAEWLKSNALVPLTTAEVKSDEELKESNGHASEQKTFLFLTCGDWDFSTCLPRQLEYHGKSVDYPGFWQWVNIKYGFSSLYGTKAKGMTSMLGQLDLELEGRHHSGIDDCRNIARICKRMLRDGWEPEATSTVSPKYLPL